MDSEESNKENTTRIYNKYQTDLSTLKLTKEEKTMLFEYIDAVPFIRNLISIDRPRIKDLPRYEEPNVLEDDLIISTAPTSKIRVDLANPHILENMDDFTEVGRYYEKHKAFTHFLPSKNPYSDYVQFWNREVQRCWHGMTRESDGEWISGYNYFYWNYCRILQSKERKTKGSKRADRTYLTPKKYDGDYWFFHYLERAREQGKHTATLKKRGSGYSYKAGAKLARNFILGESADANQEVASFAIANEKEYLTKDGILNKFISIVDFIGDNTPFPRRRELKDSLNAMHWIMGYKDVNTGLEKGTKNQVMGVTLKNDPEKARGKRGVLIEWEEFGKFDDAITAWNIARPSVEEDEFAFGLMNAYGTGGTKGAAFEGLRNVFYGPAAYNILELDNVYDKNPKLGSKCAFFHGAYLNAKGYYDNDGNSDVIGALAYIIKQRVELKYNARDADTLSQRIAEYPLVPQEAILEVGGNIFPKVELMDYLEECRINEGRFTEDILVGELILLNQDEVKFQPNDSLTPIRRFNDEKKGVNTAGAIEIFKVPEKNPDSYRYIAGIDPIDNDYIEKGSLGSIFIFDTYTDQIVAEYTGRPRTAEDFYETCRRLLLYYKAQGLYESNIKGLFGYFSNKNQLYLLSDTPQYLRDQELTKAVLSGNRSKGVHVTPGISAEGKRLQKSWMLSDYVYNDGEEEKKKLMLRTIKSLAYLEEAVQYNDDGNFDRVSAMDLVMILRKDRLRHTEQRKQEDYNIYIEEDPFIKNNYDAKFFKGNDLEDLISVNYENKLSKTKTKVQPEI